MKRFFLNILILISITGKAIAQSDLPIKSARTITINTNEGSNMDVDISPDGKVIVFDLLGDLFTVPATGGYATQITRGLALHSSPVWSPDGKKIACISDYSGSSKINVIDVRNDSRIILGRSDEPLRQNQKPFWSPDGNYIAVGSFIYGLVGGKTTLPLGAYDDLLQFPSNLKGVYYARDDRSLYWFEYATKHAERQFSVRHPYSSTITLSPDGRWLAYASDSSANKCLIIRDLSNNSERVLIHSLLAQFPNYKPYTQPRFSFSKDSKYIFIGYSGKLHRLDVRTGQDNIIPFVTKIKADLGPLDYNKFHVNQRHVEVRYTRSANASPDNRHLVFSALHKIYRMDLPKGNPRLLVDQPFNQYYPVYSPDGKWIAYVSWCDTIGGYLWRVPAAGGKAEKLTVDAGRYQQPAWSPDSKYIAVIKSDPQVPEELDHPAGAGKLELISLQDRSISVINDSVSLWNSLGFSPDGNHIIYEPPVKKNGSNWQEPIPELVSRNIIGEGEELLARGGWPAEEGVTRCRSISPDGRFIVYSIRKDMYLVPFFRSGLAPIIYDEKQKTSVIRFAKGIDPFWEKGGKVLSWSFGNYFYRIDPEKILKAAQTKAVTTPPGEDLITVTVTPDQVVQMNVRVPANIAQGVLVIKNARIITMEGNRVIEHGTIVMRNGKFVSVGANQNIPIPFGAKVLNLVGKTIMPGFVDMHLHMNVPTTVIPQQHWRFLANLAYGVTTARDPANNDEAFGYAECLRTGQMLGPRMFNTGRPLMGISDGEGTTHLDNLSEANDYVGKRAALGATVVKQYILQTRMERQWLLMASRSAGLNMTNEGSYDPLLQFGQVKDGSTGIEHVAYWGELYNDALSFLAKSGTYLTPTLMERYGSLLFRTYADSVYWNARDPKLEYFLPVDQLSRLHRKHYGDTSNAGLNAAAIIYAQIAKRGRRVLMGSHGDEQGTGPHNEIWALKAGGLSNLQALQSATIKGAEGLGMQQDIGSIKAGKIADLIILNSNPLDDIHNSRDIKYVMKDGILYDGDNLNEVWPKRRLCPEWKLKTK